MVEYPRWFIRVLQAVGLSGAGDTGVAEMGDRIGAIVKGDLSDNVGRLEVVEAEMFKDNLGFEATRELSMLTDVVDAKIDGLIRSSDGSV